MRRIFGWRWQAAGFFSLLLPGMLWAQAPKQSIGYDGSGQYLSASSLRASLLHGTAAQRKSVPLAFGVSALVPGLGQAYNGHWTKAVIALGAEVAIITLYATWRSKGNSGREFYQSVAHQDWSPLRYAYWLNDYVQYLNARPGERVVSANPIDITPELQAIDFQQPDSWTQGQALLVRSLFLVIRGVEGEVYHPETGASFSHKLPFFGEQQYYELVGKYFQFAPGWEDYRFNLRNGVPTWIDAEGNFLASIDPEMTAADGSKPNVSAAFRQYARDHASANTYFRRASRITILLIVNHLLAAVDAAIFAKLHNDRLRAQVYLSPDEAGVMQPTASLTIGL